LLPLHPFPPRRSSDLPLLSPYRHHPNCSCVRNWLTVPHPYPASTYRIRTKPMSHHTRVSSPPKSLTFGLMFISVLALALNLRARSEEHTSELQSRFDF